MFIHSIKFKVLMLSVAILLSSNLYAGFVDINADLRGVHYSSLSWGDYNNDGDLDLALAGYTDSVIISKIYRNNGGTFGDIGADIIGVGNCSIAWGDYDNDGDLDLALAGYTGGVIISKIYRNNGGTFGDIGADIIGVGNCSIAWGDYDNDGDLDLALAGIADGGGRISKIYRNNVGIFVDIGADIAGVGNCSLSWGDYDNDGDLDLVLAGIADGGGRISKIYRNNGGIFVDIGADIVEVSMFCSLTWGDYDNDGALDLALAGQSDSGYISKIYRNNVGIFVDIGADIAGVANCSLSWGDYDNDGALDLALAGDNIGAGSGRISKIYRNNGNTFGDIGTDIAGVLDCSLTWGDYDNDGVLDLALAGDTGSDRISKIYRNDGNIQNKLPNPPTSGFNTNYNSATGNLELRWGNGSDTETPSAGLYYEVRVSTTPINANTSSWVVSVSAGKGVGSSGQQTIGNYPHGKVSSTQCGVNLKVPNVKYYWQVRTIDTGLGKSNWSAVQVSPTLSPSGIDSIKVFPNPFTPKRHTHVTFDNLTTDSEIKIYTITGELVTTVDYTTKNGQAKWYGKNDSGKTVASGIYIALIKSQSQTKRLKFAVEK